MAEIKRNKKSISKSKKITIIIIIFITICCLSIGLGIYGYNYYKYNIYSNAKTPIFELPVEDVTIVTGIQTFYEEHGGTIHSGFDFELQNNTIIYAPCDGTINFIGKNQMSNDYWLIGVFISFNVRWETFIAFEPWTTDEIVINKQLENISVTVGQKVNTGDELGILNPVIGSEFPHIHWNVLEEDFLRTGPGTNKSPYDYCSEIAKADLDYLCTKFGKPPSYL